MPFKWTNPNCVTSIMFLAPGVSIPLSKPPSAPDKSPPSPLSLLGFPRPPGTPSLSVTSPGLTHNTKPPSLSFSLQLLTDPHCPDQPLSPSLPRPWPPACVGGHTASPVYSGPGCWLEAVLFEDLPWGSWSGVRRSPGWCWLLSKVLTGILLKVSLATPSYQA